MGFWLDDFEDIFQSEKNSQFYDTYIVQLGKKLCIIVNTRFNLFKLLNNLQTCIHQIGKNNF